MELKITQTEKAEIDRNLKLQIQILDIIADIKKSRKITRLNESCIESLCFKLKTYKRSYQDLRYYLAQLLEDEVLTDSEYELFEKTVCSIHNNPDKDAEYFVDDSLELSEKIYGIYLEIKELNEKELEKYFSHISAEVDKDKYLLYIYRRAFEKIHHFIYPGLPPKKLK